MSTNNKDLTRQSLKVLDELTQSPLTLGPLIWSIRQGEDMSQVEMAQQLGISRQHLCDLEHDRKSVSPKLAARYAKQLGYSQEQFVRLALQNQVDQAGLRMSIEVVKQSPSNQRKAQS